MAMPNEGVERRRTPLTRERVLAAAVALADEHGIAAVTMRRLAQTLGVEAMSLYNHVANKDDVLNGMIDAVMGEIVAAAAEVDPPARRSEWKRVARQRILAARDVQLRHRWAYLLFQSRARMTPAVLGYFESLLALLRSAGFSLDSAHHALHALGTHALGFTQEMFGDDGDLGPEITAVAAQRLVEQYPNISEMLRTVSHDPASTLGVCDDQFEFEFALDLLLDGLERLRRAEATSRG